MRYSVQRLSADIKPLHIFFCMVDHFEPGTGSASHEIEKDRMKLLLSEYPRLATSHRDYFGNLPKRTWFFPPHYHRHNNLKEVVSLCENGYGEIELHLHHGKTRADTAENLEKTILQCIEEYGYFGIFGEKDGRKRYGFVHGDYALNNSRNGKYCGVNNEIQILEKTGCYADFTFPTMQRSNPSQINSIYYAPDDPGNPQSYKKGRPVSRSGGKTGGGVMMIQGPIHPFFLNGKVTGLRHCGDFITGIPPITSGQVDLWVKTRIHVKGKRDYIFLKTQMHGAIDSKAVLGEEMHFILNYLETKYNDGKSYILHYVTAREFYNIIKAIEAGEDDGDPEEYRDYEIKLPLYDSSPSIPEASDFLKGLVGKTYG
jgi:hypothetical protein